MHTTHVHVLPCDHLRVVEHRVHFGSDGVVRVEAFELGVMRLNQVAQVSDNDIVACGSEDIIHNI